MLKLIVVIFLQVLIIEFYYKKVRKCFINNFKFKKIIKIIKIKKG